MGPIGAVAGPFWTGIMNVSMDEWFQSVSSRSELAVSSLDALQSNGFVVIRNAIPAGELEVLASSYNDVVAQAPPGDVKAGSTTIRISDLLSRSSAFDNLYVYPPLLHACSQVMKVPFKLSTMLARTLKPRVPAQRLHVDFAADARGWPMVGFILMLDEFQRENGATCFCPGSQGSAAPHEMSGLVPACGTAGSMIIYNGSVWHGHGANQTDRPRRSIQGAYIRRTEQSGEGTPRSIPPHVLGRIGPLGKYLLDL